MDITTQIISGSLDNSNKYCIDWNHAGVIAFASASVISIIDSSSMKIVQSFTNKSVVNNLKFSPVYLADEQPLWPSLTKQQQQQQQLYGRGKLICKLASADELGMINVWNILEGKSMLELYEANRVNQMSWIDVTGASSTTAGAAASRPVALLAVLYANAKFVIWDAVKGNKHWSKTFNETITRFALDPHDYGRMSFLGPNYIQFLRVNWSRMLSNSNSTGSSSSIGVNEPLGATASSNGKTERKLYFVSQEQASGSNFDAPAASSRKSFNLFTGYLKAFIDGEQTGVQKKQLDSSMHKQSLKECVQVEFHPFMRNVLLLVYPREIYIFELIINQTIGLIQLDRTHSPFIQLYCCTLNDMFYLLHDNGSVSVHVRDSATESNSNSVNTNNNNNNSSSRSRAATFAEPLNEAFFDMFPVSLSYTPRLHTDQVRLSKGTQVFGFAVSPLSQSMFAVLLSDGRILKYELFRKKSQLAAKQQLPQTTSTMTAATGVISGAKRASLTLADLDLAANGAALLAPLKCSLTDMTNPMPKMPFVMKVCPPLTKKNSRFWQPLVALGCASGSLHVFNLNSNCVCRRLLLYTHPVIGIEWISQSAVITWSWSFYNPNSSSSSAVVSAADALTNKNQMVKNELLFTDLRTGESQSFRPNLTEESPIVSAKLSTLRQYLVILFKDQPLEIWNMNDFSMIKRISKKSPIITVLEWFPYSSEARKHNVEAKYSSGSGSDSVGLETTASAHSETTPPTGTGKHSPLPEPSVPAAVSTTTATTAASSSTTAAAAPTTASPTGSTPTASGTAPLAAALSPAKENFVCVDEHGLMYSFAVESNHIRDAGKVLPEDGIVANLTSMAIKRDYIMFGDADGLLIRWDNRLKSSKQLAYKRGEIRKLKFAPGKENLLLLICMSDGLEVIEAHTFESVSSFRLNAPLGSNGSGSGGMASSSNSSSSSLIGGGSAGSTEVSSLIGKGGSNSSSNINSSGNAPGGSGGSFANSSSRMLDCDWCSSDKILVQFADGVIKVFNINFKQDSNQINQAPNLVRQHADQLYTRPLYAQEFTALKRSLVELVAAATDDDQTSGNGPLLSDLTASLKQIVLDRSSPVSSESSSASLAGRATTLSLLCAFFGCCSFESQVWALLAYVTTSATDTAASEYAGRLCGRLIQHNQFVWKQRHFRRNAYQLLRFYKEKREAADTNNILIRDLLLCNEVDIVFNMLLETDVEHDDYVSRYQKACLITSVKCAKENAGAQTSIKLVATNLIANGKLLEGIELLCLIGLVYDACRYLQDNGQWEKAAWLAKMRLAEEEHNEVIKRWCDHLLATQNKESAILLYISCQQFNRAIEVMSQSQYDELAYYFLGLCSEFGLVSTNAAAAPVAVGEQNVEAKSATSGLLSTDEIVDARKRRLGSSLAVLSPSSSSSYTQLDEKLAAQIRDNFFKLRGQPGVVN